MFFSTICQSPLQAALRPPRQSCRFKGVDRVTNFIEFDSSVYQREQKRQQSDNSNSRGTVVAAYIAQNFFGRGAQNPAADIFLKIGIFL
jgi:hypothetical protein